jgi:hypothetical protein
MQKNPSEIRISGTDSTGQYTSVVIPYSPDISELLQAFERFMRGYGYYFDGHLDIVEDDSE